MEYEGKDAFDEECLNVGHALLVKNKGSWVINPDLSVDTNAVNIKMNAEIIRINETLDEGDFAMENVFTIDNIINNDILAKLMTHWQAQCFQSNTTYEKLGNIERLLNTILNPESTTVAICISWNNGWIGSATLEKGTYGSMRNPRLWIHEVCKAGDALNERATSPIPKIFEVFFNFAQMLTFRGKSFKEVWLLVEKKPEHGFGGSLNSLYMKKYGFRMEKSPLSNYTAMKRDLSLRLEELPGYTPLEVIINTLSKEYRSRVKFLKDEGLDITGDGELNDIQEKYLALFVKNRAGKTKKHKKKKENKRPHRKRNRGSKSKKCCNRRKTSRRSKRR